MIDGLEAFLIIVFGAFCVFSIVFYFKLAEMIHVFNEVLKCVKTDSVYDVDVEEVLMK